MKLMHGLFVILFSILICVNSQSNSCIKCDTENEIDCGHIDDSPSGPSVETCNPALGCFTEIYENTNNNFPGFYTRRGCIEDSTSCFGNNCVTCTTNNCNSAVFPANRHRCQKCVDNDCSSPKSEYCNIHLTDSQDCVTLFDEDGRVLLKSCYSDIPDSTREICNDENYLDCKKCTGENCNVETIREGTKCHQCSGADCLIITTPGTLVDCRSSCYIGSDLFGEPIRGCSSDFTNIGSCSRDETSSAECFICEGDGCNAIMYPLNGRLQCRTCSDGDCSLSEDNLEFCSRYSKDEYCATIFDDVSDTVISRGCVSSLETHHQESCQNNDSFCLKCSYDKCNKDDSKFKSEFCIECNSEDDPNCLKENTIFETRCATNQCFTRLIEKEDKYFGQHMERGCLADLLQATLCNAPDCISCSGRNCNNQLFPTNRISCKSCQLETCNGRAVDKICNQYVSDESCLTYYGQESEVIYRECYSDAPKETRENCDDPTNLECTKCIGSLCNIDGKRRGNKCYKCEGLECVNPGPADLIDCSSECFVGVNSNGEPVRGCAGSFTNSENCGVSDMTCIKCNEDYCNGIFYPTKDRLTCVKCLNNDCITLNSVIEYCERWHRDERCVSIFDEADNIIERGCSSTIQNALTCNNNNPNCLKCNFDECNVEISVNEKYHCIACNSKEESKCVSSPLSTQVDACRINRCYTRLLSIDGIGQHIERGCLTSNQQCTGSSCTSCEGERCNALDFPIDRHSCYHCVGELCALGQHKEKKCTIYSQTQKNCITIYGEENDVIYRDCYIDSSEGTRSVCDDKSDLICSTCTGNLCNNDIARRGTKCLKCEGVECFNENDISNSVDCIVGGCYVGINANGETRRDCASAISTSSSCTRNETQSGNCLVCEGDYCNSIVFPINNRLICRACQGESCEGNVSDEKYCEKLNQNERCVSIFDESNLILERGCSSTVQHESICSASDPNCVKCNFNRCNNHNSRNEQNHCISCNSKDDPNCVESSSLIHTKACSTNQCYSRLLPSSSGSIFSFVEKGCVADLSSANECNGGSCTICEGDRCNNILYPSDRISCLHCRNEACRKSEATSKYCQLYNNQRQSCISLFDNNNEVFYRGCYADAANGTKDVCDDESQLLCTKCTSQNCNQETSHRGKKCYKCRGLECFIPSHPADVVDCLSNCYVGLDEAGNTVRDCSSSISNSPSCGEEDDGTNRCKICSDDFCNGIQFPIVNRLQCHVCNNEDCEADAYNLEYCERYHEHERCVAVFSQEDKVIERGCSSNLLNQLYCDANKENCVYCSTNGCNSVSSKIVRKCIVCDSSNDPNCVRNPTLITDTSCRLGCYTRLINGTLHRGCYESLGESFDCIPENNCNFCDDVDKCNVENYPSDRKTCLTCNDATTCRNPSKQLCINHKTNDKCVTVFNGYQVARKGCLADQSATNQAVCLMSSNVLCTACSSRDNCNFETVRKDENCIVCNSALDSNCAQRPSSMLSEHCAMLSNGQCFSRILNGATVRGCQGLLSSSEVDQCRNNTISSQCTITSGQGSNNQIIPINRRRCYYCDSRVDGKCIEKQTNQTATLPCKRFVQPETCVKLKLSDGAIVRGCLADYSEDICQQETCVTKCSNVDGCNDSHGTIVSINIFCLIAMLFITIFKSS